MTPYIPTSADAWREYIKVYPERADDGSTAHFNAFTHAYSSARLAQEYSPIIAPGLGSIWEFFGVNNSDDSHRQDYYNNRVGIDLVRDRSDIADLTPAQIAQIIKVADDNGALAVTNTDERIQEIPNYWSLSQMKDFFRDLGSPIITPITSNQDASNLLIASQEAENNILIGKSDSHNTFYIPEFNADFTIIDPDRSGRIVIGDGVRSVVLEGSAIPKRDASGNIIPNQFSLNNYDLIRSGDNLVIIPEQLIYNFLNLEKNIYS